MEKNKFEKQVSEKLENLSFSPSQKVWEQVDLEINKKQPRKKSFFLLPIILILMLVAGIFLIKTVPRKAETIAQIPFSGNVSKSDVVTGNSSTYPPLKPVEGSKDLSVIRPESDHLKRNSVLSHEKTIAKEETPVLLHSKKDKVTPEIRGFRKNILPLEEQMIGADTAVFSLKDLGERFDSISLSGKNVSDNRPSLITASDTLFSNKKMPEQAVLQNNQNKNTFLKRWNVGISVSGGQSALSSGIFPEKALQYADYNTPETNSNGGIRPVIAVPAPRLTQGFAFSFGLHVGKDISQTIRISSGLVYSAYSINQKEGFVNFSTSYYDISPARDFTNRFRYLEIPLALTFQLFGNDQTALELEAGGSFGTLLYSNSIQYDEGRYINHGSFFQKHQYQAGAGLSLKLFEHFNVGPSVRFSLNSLGSKGLYKDKHLNFFGIKTGFNF